MEPSYKKRIDGATYVLAALTPTKAKAQASARRKRPMYKSVRVVQIPPYKFRGTTSNYAVYIIE